jgi:hypothetical protein
VTAVHFGFDDEQLALRDAVRDLLAKECPPEVVRAAWEAPPGELDRSVWNSLGEMGVFHMLIPEAGGGLGLDERSLVLVLEETGYAGLPHPVVETAAVTIPLVAEASTIGTGVTPVDSPAGRALTSSLITSNLGGPHVPCAEDADAILYLFPGEPEGPALFLAGLSTDYTLDPQQVVKDRFTFEPLDTVDRGRRAAKVTGPSEPGIGPGHHYRDIAPSGTDAGRLGGPADGSLPERVREHPEGPEVHQEPGSESRMAHRPQLQPGPNDRRGYRPGGREGHAACGTPRPSGTGRPGRAPIRAGARRRETDMRLFLTSS